MDILKKYNRYSELYNYIIDEFKLFHKRTGRQNIQTFCKSHNYITYELLSDIGIDDIYEDVGLVKQRFSIDDYKNNFEHTVNELGYIPLYNEFNEKTKISINSYSNKFSIHKNIYDEIVKMYSTESDYQDYMKRKKEHKSSVGRKTGGMSAKHTEEELRNNLMTVFNQYHDQYGKYPSRREFNKISKHDDSVYRKRFKISWTEIREMFGFDKTA